MWLARVSARATTIRQGLGHRCCCYVMSDNATQNICLKWGICNLGQLPTFHFIQVSNYTGNCDDCMHLQCQKWKKSRNTGGQKRTWGDIYYAVRSGFGANFLHSGNYFYHPFPPEKKLSDFKVAISCILETISNAIFPLIIISLSPTTKETMNYCI